MIVRYRTSYVQYCRDTLPLLIVFHSIIGTQLYLLREIKMSKELLLQHQEHVNPLQNEKDSESKERIKIHDNIEQEIECPRCYDIMELSSDFDKLSYFCQECNLSLLIN